MWNNQYFSLLEFLRGMKKTALLFTLIFAIGLFNTAMAQCRMTLPELEKIAAYDAEKFERFVNKAGYVLVPKNASNAARTYKCSKANKDNNTDQLDWSLNPGAIPLIQVTTSDIAYFELLKKTMLKGKYKFSQELPMQVSGVNTRQHLYYSPKHAVSVYSYTIGKTVWHTFQICRSY
jgi:hypothetical protein